MQASDFYAGPILRRTQQDMVTIWFATTRDFLVDAVVRAKGEREWRVFKTQLYTFPVFPKLFVHLILILPTEGRLVPANTLLEYALGEFGEDGFTDFEEFGQIARDEGLVYEGFEFPSFYIQKKGRPLNVLYGSCRKPHGTDGGDDDALFHGDVRLAETATDLAKRPTILCLGGDQIYADDVSDGTFDQLATVAKAIEAPAESLPDGLAMPAKGERLVFTLLHAAFTSGEAANHLVSFAEYVAMYGLVWNANNWPKSVTDKEVSTFVGSLPNVRRLLANIPTYMLFDDHDVTDDWNLSVHWSLKVKNKPLGKRIVANALCAYFLFQGWGNDPLRFMPTFFQWQRRIKQRATEGDNFDEFMWAQRDWEFFTPTYPFVYALDTRTERGSTEGSGYGTNEAPAYLRDTPGWKRTIQVLNKLISRQGGGYPVVFMSAQPVFGFDKVDSSQVAITAVKGPYYLDFEGWAPNRKHLALFGHLCGKNDVVLLSGDVHYAFTATVRFDNFDDEWMRMVRGLFPELALPRLGAGAEPTFKYLYSSKFLQLTSSALRNYAGAPAEGAARLSRTVGWYVTPRSETAGGYFVAPDGFLVTEWTVTLGGVLEALDLSLDLATVKPRCGFMLRYNDNYNQAYYRDHNLGLARFEGRTLRNVFLTANGATAEKSWDFNNEAPWANPPKDYVMR